MTDLESDVFRRDYGPAHGTRPTVVDSTEKKEAATTGPNPESGDEAVGAGGTAPDTSRSSAITDHGFWPSERSPYLCDCGLAEAAHTRRAQWGEPFNSDSREES